MTSLAVGIVGIGGRGGSFTPAIEAHEHAVLRAICDVDDDALAHAARTLPDAASYTDFETMLAEAALDLIIVGTPMPYHATQSIAALEQDIHVLSEVPAAVSIEECKDLVAAAANASACYGMLENYCFRRPTQHVRALVKAGVFGEVYYAEAEYLHELKGLNETTPWRRTWQTGIDGITYPTHCLGPVLQWFGDDRLSRITCVGAGHHATDPRGEHYEQQDTTILLGKTEADRVIKLRLDMLSDRIIPCGSPNTRPLRHQTGTRGEHSRTSTITSPAIGVIHHRKTAQLPTPAVTSS